MLCSKKSSLMRRLLVFALPCFSVFCGLLFTCSPASAGNYRVNSLSFSSPIKPDISEFSQGYSYFLFNPRTLGNFRISSPVFTINEKILVPLRVGESIHLAYVFSTGNASNVPVCPAPLANTFYELRSCTITAMDASVSSIKNVPIDTVTYPSNLFSYRVELDFTIVQDMNTLTLPMGGDFAHLYLSSSAASSFELFFDTVVINNRPLSDDAQAQIGAINNQSKQEQDRYDQDKQEESDRENAGKEDATKLGSLFTFNIINPFIGIFDMFLPGSSCASIPTLASWVHSDTTTVCSWWPSNVRNVLTPVFSLLSSMLLFGFIVRWLDKGNFSGGIEV